MASAAALLPRLAAPGTLTGVSLALTPGQDISPIDLGDLLATAGYTRQDPVDEAGEFCVRGGVVDFYPADRLQPVRLEFVGDTIESIRSYDPATQRSTVTLDQVAIIPLQELVQASDEADRPATFLDYLSASGHPTLLVSEPEEVRAQGRRAWQQVRASYDEALAKGTRVPPPDRLTRSATECRPGLAAAPDTGSDPLQPTLEASSSIASSQLQSPQSLALQSNEVGEAASAGRFHLRR